MELVMMFVLSFVYVAVRLFKLRCIVSSGIGFEHYIVSILKASLKTNLRKISFVRVRLVVVITEFRATAATNCLVLTRWMKVSMSGTSE
jgi:hypothetical protein